MCLTCPQQKPYKPTAWFNHIWMIYQLQQGGYPFKANDLTLVEWMALAEMKAAVDHPSETMH